MPEMLLKSKSWRVILLILLLLSASAVFAQQGASRQLTPETPVSGALTVNSLAQVYFLTANAGDTVNLAATSPDGFALALLLTDAQGQTIAQNVDTAGVGTVDLSAPISETGTYYITVLRAPNTDSPQVSFILTLASSTTTTPTQAVGTGESTAPAVAAGFTESTPVLLSGGLQVTLRWNTTADLNLQVRDPSGQTLFWDSRTTNNGGSFGFDVNGLCETLTTDGLETATWSPGFLPSGSYEILVYYRQACEGTAPVPFTVDVVTNGTAQPPLQGTLLPPVGGQESVYISRFTIAADASASITPGSVYAGVNSLPATAAEVLSNPIQIERGTPLQGTITNDQSYVAYSFEGRAGEFITIDMLRTTGNLDTLLLLIDSNGSIVDSNDDVAFGNTNSTISNARLLTDGTYIIVASRYGKEIGGTEGTFELLLSGPTADLPAEVLNLNLPDGDIKVSLVWNTNADLQLLVRDPVGDSVYDDNLFVNSGGVLGANGNVNCVPATTGSPVSYIYWPRGFLRPGSYEVEVWFQNDCTDSRPVDFTLTVIVGNELVITQRQRPLPGQRFVQSFNVGSDGTSTAGPGGYVGASETINYRAELDSAQPITSTQPLTGVISTENPFDLYVFEGAAGDVVTISMPAATATLDTKLFLIAPSGIEAAENDDAVPGDVTNALISDVTLTETGQYVIIATRYGTIYGGTVGAYSITLRQN